MIVVDTNTIAYLYLPTTHTPSIEKLLTIDNDWAAPRLWRSEFLKILALYVRQDIVSFETACQIQSEAERLMSGNEYDIDSLSVLAKAQQSGYSAYDCEFISLARSLNTKLITADKKLRRVFPEIALTVKEHLVSL